MSGNADRSGGLADMQAAFAAGLRARGRAIPDGASCHLSQSSPRRFDIHRSTVMAGPIDALQARYPAVLRLVGEPFFRAAAQLYVMEQPPVSPALIDYGGGFPNFLSRFEPAQGLAYLADVARLEWLRHCAYHAADAQVMPATALGKVPAERIGDVVLLLHPSASVLVSDYPVFSIWETNIMDADVRPIGPDLPDEAVLIARPALEVLVMRVDRGGAKLIEAIAAGETLAAAAEQAGSISAEFDLGKALGALLAAGAFAGFTTTEDCRETTSDHHRKGGL